MFILFLTEEVYPQWVRTNSPDFGYCFAISGTNVFAGTNEGVFLSSDDGTSWTAANSGLAEAPVLSLGVSRTNLFAGTGTGLFLSTNSGTSWTAVREGLPRATYDTTQCVAISCLASSGQKLFAGTNEDGVFLFSNNGMKWSAVNSGLTDVFVRSLAVSGTDLVAGTEGRGIWRRPLSEMITSVEEPLADHRLPGNFSLEQNYPNPFNPSTTIEFSLPRTTYVTLKVFNLLGEEVATLAGQNFAAGSYKVDWNARGVASGVYLYRLVSGSFVETKKLLLLK